MTERGGDRAPRRSVTRRQLLQGGAIAGVAVGGTLAVTRRGSDGRTTAEPVVTDAVLFDGRHQAGVATPAQQHAVFIALDLRPGVGRAALARMMGLLTADARALTAGLAPLADSEPELAAAPGRLTITFGFGQGLVSAARRDHPSWLAPLPAFASIDQLDPRFTGGDLLFQICGDDPVAIAHARRMLVKDAARFAVPRWTQDGFRSGDAARSRSTGRNLMGQVDGTVNAVPGTLDFDRVVWAEEGWLAGGTSMVIRRIRMDLATWDELDRSGREQVIGRRLSNGAPLTGRTEREEPDFSTVDAAGFPVIAEFSHLRRARASSGPTVARQRIFRRAYNYEAPGGDPQAGVESGLIFVSYQADLEAQFLPIQERLAELDLLNQWTTPVGSAVFAIPPGCGPNGFIGETLLG